jgi:apolipoprotein N-acyltransferase
MMQPPVWLQKPWPRRAMAFLLGLTFALGQPPVDAWPVALAALAAMLWLAQSSPREAQGLMGWLFGLGYFGLSLNWIVEPFFVDAQATGWMAPFALIGMAGGLALFWALAFWLAARLGRGAWIVVTWTGIELARAYVLTGFPWGLVGYVWAETPVVQWASIAGPHGLTLAAVGLAWLAVQSRRGAVAAMALGAALMAGGWAMTPPLQDLTGRPTARLVQPNAAQHLKWQRNLIPVFFQRQVDLTAQEPKPGLVVWSETALPMLLDEADEAFSIIAEAAQGAPSVVGIQRYEDGGYFNSLAVVDAEGKTQAVYDKYHLVPFGEYMPFAAFFARFNILGLASRAEGGYAQGTGPQLLDLGPYGTALPLICYEAVFPQDVRAAEDRPDFILHLTNDAWFGSWFGPQQHLQQTRIRAVEARLPVLRSANTGISAVIDPAGRVLASLPLNQAGALDFAVPRPEAPSFYWRFGDKLALVLLSLLAFACLFRSFRKAD